MDEHEELVDRADALIRRQRSSAAPFTPAVRRTAALGDDLPLLTEVVETDDVTAAAPPRQAPADEAFSQAIVQIVAAELARSIEHRLGIELPSLVDATLATLRDDLARGVVAATEGAVQDFLARSGVPPAQEPRPPTDDPKG